MTRKSYCGSAIPKEGLRALAHNIDLLQVRIDDCQVSLHDITICKEMKFTDLSADGSADVVESSSSCRRRREPLLTIHRPDLPRDIAAAAACCQCQCNGTRIRDF